MNVNTKRIAPRPLIMGLVFAMAVIALPAWACPIPVYQYSLEWWERDPYEVYVFDTGVLTEDQEEAIQRLEKISQADDGAEPANLRLRRVQSESEERLYAHSALRGEMPDTLPWMVAYYPSISSHRRTPVWMGELSMANIDALLDSPVRKQLCEMILDRVSVVWVLLESGNTQADDEAASLLEQEVSRLEQTLVPPTITEWGEEDIEIADIKFKTMRLSRNNEAEQMLIAMLMNSEIDIEDYADEPIVFPIFGRGLIMDALIGRGINPHMIRTTAEFLTGPCSCTVKSLNPGVDLITTLDWGERVETLSAEFTTEPGGLGGFLDSAGEVEAP